MIPKSLHTVSVLVAVATRTMALHHNMSAASAVDYAAEMLGYGRHVDDDYALKAAAVRKLEKAVQS